jgi:hypothetical protein
LQPKADGRTCERCGEEFRVPSGLAVHLRTPNGCFRFLRKVLDSESRKEYEQDPKGTQLRFAIAGKQWALTGNTSTRKKKNELAVNKLQRCCSYPICETEVYALKEKHTAGHLDCDNCWIRFPHGHSLKVRMNKLIQAHREVCRVQSGPLSKPLMPVFATTTNILVPIPEELRDRFIDLDDYPLFKMALEHMQVYEEAVVVEEAEVVVVEETDVVEEMTGGKGSTVASEYGPSPKKRKTITSVMNPSTGPSMEHDTYKAGVAKGRAAGVLAGREAGITAGHAAGVAAAARQKTAS